MEKSNKEGRIVMRQRILTAALALAVFVPFMIKGGAWFAWLIFILGAIGLYELARMKQVPYLSEVGLVSTIAIMSIILPERYFDQILPMMNPVGLFFICGMVLLVLTVYRYDRFNFVDAATLIFGVLYIGVGMRFLIVIRDLGLENIFYLFIVIWSTDSGAYLVGKRYGHYQLAGHISPKKTIEGALGGIVTALITTSLYATFVDLDIRYGHSLAVLTVLISLAGQLGDLVESAFKRYFQVKDSGNLLPGHGGVLDRFDSSIFASILFMVWQGITNFN